MNEIMEIKKNDAVIGMREIMSRKLFNFGFEMGSGNDLVIHLFPEDECEISIFPSTKLLNVIKEELGKVKCDNQDSEADIAGVINQISEYQKGKT